MSEAPRQAQRPRHRRSRFSLEALQTPAALLEVFKSLQDPAMDLNPAGAVLQLVRCTQAVADSPLELGVASGAGEGTPGWCMVPRHPSGERRGGGRARRLAAPPVVQSRRSPLARPCRRRRVGGSRRRSRLCLRRRLPSGEPWMLGSAPFANACSVQLCLAAPAARMQLCISIESQLPTLIHPLFLLCRTQVLFDRWLAVLQQAGKRLPFKVENWETVTAGGCPLRVCLGTAAMGGTRHACAAAPAYSPCCF